MMNNNNSSQIAATTNSCERPLCVGVASLSPFAIYIKTSNEEVIDDLYYNYNQPRGRVTYVVEQRDLSKAS